MEAPPQTARHIIEGSRGGSIVMTSSQAAPHASGNPPQRSASDQADFASRSQAMQTLLAPWAAAETAAVSHE
jgi:hypothetical protein